MHILASDGTFSDDAKSLIKVTYQLSASAAKPSAAVHCRRCSGLGGVPVGARARASGSRLLSLGHVQGRSVCARRASGLLRSHIDVSKRHPPPRPREMRAEVGELAPPSHVFVWVSLMPRHDVRGTKAHAALARIERLPSTHPQKSHTFHNVARAVRCREAPGSKLKLSGGRSAV